jgi:hypothetical protein
VQVTDCLAATNYLTSNGVAGEDITCATDSQTSPTRRRTLLQATNLLWSSLTITAYFADTTARDAMFVSLVGSGRGNPNGTPLISTILKRFTGANALSVPYCGLFAGVFKDDSSLSSANPSWYLVGTSDVPQDTLYTLKPGFGAVLPPAAQPM